MNRTQAPNETKQPENNITLRCMCWNVQVWRVREIPIFRYIIVTRNSDNSDVFKLYSQYIFGGAS